MSKSSDSYTIRQMIDLTGLSEFTIRGWENRYTAFSPRRSSTGRRIYSQTDLQKALLLRDLLLRNHRIGAIAEKPLPELRALLHKETFAKTSSLGASEKFIHLTLQALSLQNWDRFENSMRHCTQSIRPREALTRYFVPLIAKLGEYVAAGTLSISQEHIFSSVLLEQLYHLRSSARKTNRSKRFVIAAPEGDHHALGISVAHSMIVLAGFRSIFLGANTPKKDLCETTLKFKATHVLLGSTVSRKEGANEDLYSYLHFLDRHLDSQITIWLGGRNSDTPPGQLSRELYHFSSLQQLDQVLYGEKVRASS